MEDHILQLLRQDGDDNSKNIKFRNNIQFAKKQYPLNQAKKLGKTSIQKTFTKAEREPLISDFVIVSSFNYECRFRTLILWRVYF